MAPTTLGYGDIAPATVLGQRIASVLMIMGYVIITVSTDIVSAQMALPTGGRLAYKSVVCRVCQAQKHRADAEYC